MESHIDEISVSAMLPQKADGLKSGSKQTWVMQQGLHGTNYGEHPHRTKKDESQS
jgi:hypothetical protein